VFSDYFLFDRIVGVGRNGADERARDYLARLHLDHKCRSRRRVLHDATLAGPAQAPRAALRYLEDRPFTCFDEWASDQDPLFKEVFYTQLLPELRSRGKAVLVITHDDRYFRLRGSPVVSITARSRGRPGTAAGEVSPFPFAGHTRRKRRSG